MLVIDSSTKFNTLALSHPILVVNINQQNKKISNQTKHSSSNLSVTSPISSPSWLSNPCFQPNNPGQQQNHFYTYWQSKQEAHSWQFKQYKHTKMHWWMKNTRKKMLINLCFWFDIIIWCVMEWRKKLVRRARKMGRLKILWRLW